MAVQFTDSIAKIRAVTAEAARSGSIGKAASVVSPAGATMFAVSFLAWIVAWRLGWQEFAAIAAIGSCALLLASVFLIGKSSLVTTLALSPQRLFVGTSAVGELSTVARGRRGFIPMQLELPVSSQTTGRSLALERFDVPRITSDEAWTELFELPTSRRGVIQVGPVQSVRGDPLGLLRRTVRLTQPETLFVHPRVVQLEQLASGVMRDLEGQTTPDVSASDVVFHTLREYVPGDDRKHIDWRASAKVQSSSGDRSKFMVRQFVDTRRSHLGVVLSGDNGDFAGDGEFELAVSVAASLAARVIDDGSRVEVDAAGVNVLTAEVSTALDGFSAVELPKRSILLSNQVSGMLREHPGLSLLTVVVGAPTSIANVRSATLRVTASTRKVVIMCSPGAASGFKRLGDLTILTLGALDDLPRLMWLVGRAS